MSDPTPALLCVERHDRTGAVLILREDGSGIAIRPDDVPRLIAQLRDHDATADVAPDRTAWNAA